MEIEEVKTPEIENPEDILIRIKRSLICGTDIKTFRRGHHAFIPPVILGHEFAGEVVATGEKVKVCTAGDQVTLPPFLNCGDCYSCQRGLFELCPNRTLLSNGSFAEYIKVSQPYAAAGMVKLAPDANLEEAALSEPLACVINAVEDCDICLGENVLDRKSTRLNSSHVRISYAVFCLKKKNKQTYTKRRGHLQQLR